RAGEVRGCPPPPRHDIMWLVEGNAMQHLRCFLTVTGLVFGSVFPNAAVFAQGNNGGAAMGPNSAPQPSFGLNQPVVGETVDRGWYVTGKVLMDDGSAPPANVTVQ